MGFIHLLEKKFEFVRFLVGSGSVIPEADPRIRFNMKRIRDTD